MIRFSAVGYVLGQFLLVLAATMLVPVPFSLFGPTGDLRAMSLALAVTLGAGGILFFSCPRPRTELTLREGLLLVCSVWVAVAAFGSLPFYFSPHFQSFTDAFFESASGFTTTGATILSDVEVLPSDLQFWRHFSHWLGGMGIVLLGVAILPLLGLGGMHLYRAEFSGAKSDKLKPRITETAFSLWKIYFALTAIECAALRWAGMTWYESVCHAFSTMGTGGFSTRTASIGGFQNPLIEYIIIFFMLLAGINFTRHYQLFVERRPRLFFADLEVRSYAGIALGASAIVTYHLMALQPRTVEDAFRTALFQVSSILTTTGFATDDFEAWQPLPQLMLLALMFCGGCTGSTAGGLKVSRVVMLTKVVLREFKRMVERRAVIAIRMGANTVPETTIASLLNLVYLAFLVNFFSCLLLAAVGVDVLTCISAVAAAMFSIGPGLGEVGPAEHYGNLPALAKWVLSGCMIAGRLEFYSALVVLSPAFWKK